MMNLFNILEGGAGSAGVGSAAQLCEDMAPVLRIVGIVILGIKIVVPIILIIVGMIDLAKAVTEKSEDNIKKAQQALIKKAITAVLVFLVATIVGVLMTLVGQEDYKNCTTCLNHPFSCNSDYGELGE